MHLFRYLFKNYFNDPRITDERLRKFTNDHLARLEQSNENGVFSLLITDTKAAFNEYFNSPKGEQSGQALSPMANLEELIWQFKVNVTEKEALIRSTFKKGTYAYNSFFPRGLAEYTKANKETIGPLLQRFAGVASSHQHVLGDSVSNYFKGLQSTYQQLSKPADGGQVATAEDSTYRRAFLEQQLCRNLHFIAYHYSGNTEKCFSLFDHSLLRLRLSEESEVFTGVIFFGATINVISMGITHHTTFKVRNIGQVPLRCCLAENADTACTGTFFEVAPQQEMSIPADELGDPSVSRFFNITNLSDDIGRYEVLMEE